MATSLDIILERVKERKLRAEIDGDTIYLWQGATMIGVAIGNIKDGWRCRPVGGRLGRKRFSYAPDAFADRLGFAAHRIRDAIIHEHARKMP